MDFNALYGMHAKDKQSRKRATHTLQTRQMALKCGQNKNLCKLEKAVENDCFLASFVV